MSGMRVIWLVGALLVGAAAMLLLTDHRTPPGEARTTATTLDAPRAVDPAPGAPAAAPTATPAPPAAGTPAPAAAPPAAEAPKPSTGTS